MFQPPLPANPYSAPVSSVSDFVLHIRETLEAHLPLAWVGGEVSGLTRASSGHLYFTLKDARAQIRCTMWRNRAQLLAFQLRDGMRVDVRGLVSVYEARGDLQLSIETVRQAGLGSLYEAFVALKRTLEAEGLFRAETKRALPPLPRGIGLICSPAAAALHDMLTALARRAPAIPLVLYPAPVQGTGASARLAEAIATANARAAQDGIDLLILARGGGSLEDLWAFNEEPLIRAIAASTLPVLCGVGHETDTTLADLAADLRAATPTAAAELASAGWFECRTRLPRLAARLSSAMTRRVGAADQAMLRLQQRLFHPRDRLARSADKLDGLARRLHSLHTLRRHQADARLAALGQRLRHARPSLERPRARLDALQRVLQQALQARLAHAHSRLDRLAQGLALLNPEAILDRGYAIVRDAEGQIVRRARDLPVGAVIDVQLSDGHLRARTTETKTEP